MISFFLLRFVVLDMFGYGLVLDLLAFGIFSFLLVLFFFICLFMAWDLNEQ